MNVRSETIKFLEENIDLSFTDTGLNSVFVALMPKARKIKAKISKSDYIKLKSFVQWRKLSSFKLCLSKWKGNLLSGRRYLQITVPWSQIEPVPTSVEALSLNHCTAREALVIHSYGLTSRERGGKKLKKRLPIY